MLALWTVLDSKWPGEDVPLFSLHYWCTALRQKGRRWHPERHIFQNLGSWLGLNRTKVSVSTKTRTSSGTSKSPMTSSISRSFFQEMDTLVRLKPSHRSRFWQICRYGCHRRPFCRSALHQWCKLKNGKWNIFTRSLWIKNRSSMCASHIMRMCTLCGYLVQRRDLVQG